MLKPWMYAGVVCLGLLCPMGCGKKTNQEYLSNEGKKLVEAEVTVTEIPTTAKSPKGKPVRVYDVAVPSTKMRNVIVVAGNTAVPVEIPNARFVIVGGKKAELNFATNSAAFVVPVADPVCGYRQVDTALDDVVKMAKANGTMEIPVIDLLP